MKNTSFDWYVLLQIIQVSIKYTVYIKLQIDHFGSWSSVKHPTAPTKIQKQQWNKSRKFVTPIIWIWKKGTVGEERFSAPIFNGAFMSQPSEMMERRRHGQKSGDLSNGAYQSEIRNGRS